MHLGDLTCGRLKEEGKVGRGEGREQGGRKAGEEEGQEKWEMRGRWRKAEKGSREVRRGRKAASAWLPARCFHFPLSCHVTFIRSRQTKAQ